MKKAGSQSRSILVQDHVASQRGRVGYPALSGFWSGAVGGQGWEELGSPGRSWPSLTGEARWNLGPPDAPLLLSGRSPRLAVLGLSRAGPFRGTQELPSSLLHGSIP